MSFVKEPKKIKIITVTLFVFLFLLSSCLTITSQTRALEKIKSQLLSKMDQHTGFMNTDNEAIKSIINELIQLSEQPETINQTQAFTILIEKTRKLVDEMHEEQKQSDITFKNTTNLLIKYSIRQKHAVEFVQDKHMLSTLFLEFLQSIQASKGLIDISVDYKKLREIMTVLKLKFDDYSQSQSVFELKFAQIYSDMVMGVEQAVIRLENYKNPFMEKEMKNLLQKLKTIPLTATKAISNSYLYNINPNLEKEMIASYLLIFDEKNERKSGTIPGNLFKGLDLEIIRTFDEVSSFASLLTQAKESMKLVQDSLKSNIEEYNKNTKFRQEVVDTILKMLDLMNKRMKKISGPFLVYLENILIAFGHYENSFEFKKYKQYIFKDVKFNELGEKLTDNYHKTKLTSF